MNSVKSGKSFSEIVSIISKDIRKKKEKNANSLHYVGPASISYPLLFILAIFLAARTTWYEVMGDGTSWFVVTIFGTLTFLSVACFVIAILQPDVKIYPKAFWYWLRGKDPEIS